MPTKTSIECVKKIFTKNSCDFLDNFYVNANYKHNYKCKCGNESQISLAKFKNGQRCFNCSGNKKYELEEVKKTFLSNGCKFLDTNYQGANFSHNYKCRCGNESKISFANFKNGRRCMNCMGSKKKIISDVKKIFLKNGCEFLDSDYYGSRHLHNYKCSCGEIAKTRFYSFSKGHRCSNCGKNKKYDLCEVKNIFKENHCEFLDNFYVNANHKHRYICICGKESGISLKMFLKGQRCSDCGGTKKKKLEEIKKIFISYGCEFIDEIYVNARHPHNYKCKCGNLAKISLSNLKQGNKCRKCQKTGFSISKNGFLYLLCNENMLKIGIYNVGSNRIKNHMKKGWKLIDQIGPCTGEEILNMEKEILKIIDNINVPRGKKAFQKCFDGYTESWLKNNLNVEKIQEIYDRSKYPELVRTN